MVRSRHEEYKEQPGKRDAIAEEVIQMVHDQGGRFLRDYQYHEEQLWVCCAPSVVKTKVKQALRDMARRKVDNGSQTNNPVASALTANLCDKGFRDVNSTSSFRYKRPEDQTAPSPTKQAKERRKQCPTPISLCHQNLSDISRESVQRDEYTDGQFPSTSSADTGMLLHLEEAFGKARGISLHADKQYPPRHDGGSHISMQPPTRPFAIVPRWNPRRNLDQIPYIQGEAQSSNQVRTGDITQCLKVSGEDMLGRNFLSSPLERLVSRATIPTKHGPAPLKSDNNLLPNSSLQQNTSESGLAHMNSSSLVDQCLPVVGREAATRMFLPSPHTTSHPADRHPGRNLTIREVMEQYRYQEQHRSPWTRSYLNEDEIAELRTEHDRSPAPSPQDWNSS